MRHPSRLLAATSTLCLGISVWVMASAIANLPRLSESSLRSWLTAMAVFLVAGSVGWALIRLQLRATAVRVAAGFFGAAAFVLGMVTVGMNEARAGTHYESYVTLAGIVLASHGLAFLAWLFAQLKQLK